MIYQRYKKTDVFIMIDNESSKYYAKNLHTHLYTSLYDKLDDLRDDLRLNRCIWIDLSKHISLLLKARGSIFS